MGFDKGTVSFRVCRLPEAISPEVVEAFAAMAIAPLEKVEDEPVIGWVSGRNLLERELHEGNAYLGSYLHLCLCQAQRKIPSALLNAKIKMTELSRMAEQKADRLSSAERKKIREDVRDGLLPSMPVTVSGVWFAVDNAAELLYVTATSDKQLDLFLGYFSKTVGFEPIPLTPEVVAEELLGVNPAQIQELNFSNTLSDANAGGTLGQNFLTWLWYFLSVNGGNLPPTREGNFTMAFDGPLLFVAEGSLVQECVLRKGSPLESADAAIALDTGKKLRRAKLTLARGGQAWTTTIDADTFSFGGMKLPDGETYDEASHFGERMEFIYQFQKIFFELFRKYVNEVTNQESFQKLGSDIKAWAATVGK